MGYQHLSPEERSRLARQGARALWNCSEDRKKELLENSFLSKEAKEKSIEKRPEALKEAWANMSPERRQARINAAAEGIRRVWRKHSDSMTKYWAGRSIEERYQHYLNSFGSEEAKKKRFLVQWESLSEEEKKKYVELRFTKQWNKQTGPEVLVEEYLNSKFPGEWKYIGKDREVSIGGKYPDFININGKKEVIEVWGFYWHFGENEEALMEHYKKYGFKCLVIWDYECNPIDIKRKMEEFN